LRFVPVFVQRPLTAAQTRSPMPLMAATGTASPRRERIPLGATRLEERLRRVGPLTTPAAGRRRPPLAQRTPDAERHFASSEIGGFERRPAWREVVLQQRQ